MVRLKEICKVDWGNTNLTKAAYTEGGEYLGVSATGCDGKFNYYNFEAYTPVISAIGANCGKMFLPQRKFVAIKNTITLVPHDCIDGKYLYYAMINNRIPKRGGGQPFISKSDTENYEIPCPSLSIQREIVRIFDILSSIIKSRQQQLQKLDELVKARFVELTGEAKTTPTRMGDVATYLNGYAFKPEQWEKSGLPIIRIQNLNDSTAIYNYYTGTLPEKYYVQNGDVLVSWATHFEAYIWKGPNAWLNQHIFKVVFDKIVVNKVYFVYACEEALRQAFRNAHGFKPTMEHIKKADFDNAIVKLPPIDVQNQFAAFVTQTDKSKAAVQKALDETQLLFDSLMQKYFG